MHYQSYRLNIIWIFTILLGLTLPYGNVTKLFGIEDGFSRLIIPVLVLLFLLRELQSKDIRISLSGEINLFLIGIIVSLFGLIIGNVSIQSYIGYSVKILVLITVYTVLTRHKEFTTMFIKSYERIFLFSLMFSIPIWFIFPMPEFVFYDGKHNRFGGFHFELFNYSFSLCIFYASWILSGRKWYVGFLIFLCLGYLSKSNMFSFFFLTFLLPNFFFRLCNYKTFSIILVCCVFFMPVVIGLFLNSFEFLMHLGIRSQSTDVFSATHSTVFLRVYPYSIAAEYLTTNGVWSLLPSGLGHFENTAMVLGDPYSFKGTGSPKALVDLGLILFLTLTYLIGNRMRRVYKLWDKNKYVVLKLYLCCLLFISFGAGFFNLIAWTVIFALSSKNLRLYDKTILHR